MNSDTGTKNINETIYYQRHFSVLFFLILLILLVLAFVPFILITIYPQSDETIIRQAAAKIVNKDPNDLTAEDFAKITQIHLSGKTRDIRLLEKFTNLEELSFKNMGIRQNNWPKQVLFLARLFHINRFERDFIDLTPLKKLTHLKKLDLYGGGPFNDIKPLAGLINLAELNLQGTMVTNIEPLKGLKNLKVLNLYETKISDLEPVKNLINLQTLKINNTKITNLEPLRGLINLERLTIDGTQITNLEPIKDLHKIEILYLYEPGVRDIGPLKKLTNLKSLRLMNCEKITGKQIEDLKKSLPDLEIKIIIFD